MPEGYGGPLNEALDYLCQLREEGLPPGAALARLQALPERHPAVELDLAWQEEAFTRSLDYYVLVHFPGDATLSLGLCPDQAVPWPLRGAQHSREDEILRVNQWRLRVEDVMT